MEGDNKPKKKRTRWDKINNISKVASVVMKNPNLTQRQIAEQAWVSVSNVNDKLNILEQYGKKNTSIINICKKDLQIVDLWQKELLRRLSKNPDKMWTRDIVAAMDTGTKRYTIFKGDITDNEWGMKQLLNPEQINKLLSRLEIDE